MNEGRIRFLFLNVGHGLDHMLMLLFPTAVLGMGAAFDAGYGELLALSVFGFVAFGAGSLPAGWLGDRWSRTGMMVVFFLGIGASTLLTGFARTPMELAIGLTAIGLFASIYHPVGIAMVAEHSGRLGWSLAVNGVAGNVGVALAGITAAGLTALWGWRAAFVVPGALTVAIGLSYVWWLSRLRGTPAHRRTGTAQPHVAVSAPDQRRIFIILVVATLFGGIVFHVLTIGLPGLLDQRLEALAPQAWMVGGFVTLVFGVAALAQLVVGWLIDRYPLRRVFVAIAAAQIPLLILAAGASEVGMLLVITAVMLLVFGEIPIHDALVARYAAPAWRSRIYAVKYLLSLGVSATAVPMIALTSQGYGGFTGLLFVLAAAAGVVTLGAVLLPPIGRPVAPQAEPAAGRVRTATARSTQSV
jgi:MFS family permease